MIPYRSQYNYATMAMWCHTLPWILTILLGTSLRSAGDPLTPVFIQTSNWNFIPSDDSTTVFDLGETVVLQMNESLWNDFDNIYQPSDDVEQAEVWVTDWPVVHNYKVQSESIGNVHTRDLY